LGDATPKKEVATLGLLKNQGGESGSAFVAFGIWVSRGTLVAPNPLFQLTPGLWRYF